MYLEDGISIFMSKLRLNICDSTWEKGPLG